MSVSQGKPPLSNWLIYFACFFADVEHVVIARQNSNRAVAVWFIDSTFRRYAIPHVRRPFIAENTLVLVREARWLLVFDEEGLRPLACCVLAVIGLFELVCHHLVFLLVWHVFVHGSALSLLGLRRIASFAFCNNALLLLLHSRE